MKISLGGYSYRVSDEEVVITQEDTDRMLCTVDRGSELYRHVRALITTIVEMDEKVTEFFEDFGSLVEVDDEED